MNDLFKTEEDAIRWVKNNTPFAIKPIRKANTMYINPFVSQNAFKEVTVHLGKKLFRLQENSKLSINKDL